VLWATTYLAPSAAASPPGTEVRDFQIFVDGKPAGHCRMTIVQAPDGAQKLGCEVDVHLVSFLVPHYEYPLRGSETWRNQRLESLITTCNDNGKRYNVAARSAGTIVRVNANGREQAARPDVWTTTYWRLPDAALRNRPLALLDVDTGRIVSVRLAYLGTQTLSIGGQPRSCSHYRMEGIATGDLWYDEQERLVRQDTVDEEKHRVTLELTVLRSEK
jgi:hypothetical protein